MGEIRARGVETSAPLHGRWRLIASLTVSSPESLALFLLPSPFFPALSFPFTPAAGYSGAPAVGGRFFFV